MADTVTVACKMPHGLILRLFEFVETTQAAPSGHVVVKEARERVNPGTDQPSRVKIQGYLNREMSRMLTPSQAPSWVLTEAVDKGFWDEWTKQNKDFDPFVNGLIFAAPNAAAAHREIANRMAMRNGFEPVDPSNMPKGVQKYDGKAA